MTPAAWNVPREGLVPYYVQTYIMPLVWVALAAAVGYLAKD